MRDARSGVWVALGLILAFAGCSDGARPDIFTLDDAGGGSGGWLPDVPAPDRGPLVDVGDAFSILGTWYTGDARCFETHQFTDAGHYTIVSTTGEQVLGTYEFTVNDGGADATLIFRVTSDNGIIDCDGLQHAETGTVYQGFVVIPPDLRTLRVFRDPGHTVPWLTLRRDR